MINIKKVLLTLFIILIPCVAIASSVYLFMKSKEGVKGVSTTTVQGCNPYINNVMPNIAYVGEEYYFIPSIVGCDRDDVELTVEGVEWIGVKEGIYIYGIPSISDLGTSKIEITVYGRSNIYTLVEYIIVKENEK